MSQEWSFHWQPFNHAFGPWYRLRAVRKDGTTSELQVGGRGCEAVIQPDMSRESWYWSVRFASYTPKMPKADDPPKRKPKAPLREHKTGGKVATIEDAKRQAIAAVMSGRPDVVGPQRVSAVEPPKVKEPKEV